MEPAGQRRARRIAMTTEERDAFLAEMKTCRVASIGADGAPHVNALWFAWDGTSLWLYSMVASQRWTNILRDPRVAVIVDAGTDYGQLRGVEILGLAHPVGEQPRRGEPNAELDPAETIFAQRYTGADRMGYDGRHAWLRVVPHKVVSWDFRKLDGATHVLSGRESG